MKIGVLKEVTPGETRVAATPDTVKRFVSDHLEVLIESGAGVKAFFSDEDYESAGARIVSDATELLSEADVVVKIHPPTTDAAGGRDEVGMLREGQVLVSVLGPLTSHDLVEKLAAAKVTSLALDTVPRITRAQSMDILSSMNTIAGYKAALLGADKLAKLCPMMMTAAGTLRPANVLVIGAGVAGLQAIATAKRLGSIVTAIDVRPPVREEVESLGAKFVPMEVHHDQVQDSDGYATDLGEEFYKGEQEIIAPVLKNSDIAITTALIPGRAAPILITREMVEQMKPGSVIVDVAASAGGNCTLTEADKEIEHGGVTIMGPTNLVAQVPIHASQMFARNIANFLKEFITDQGEIDLDMENEVIKGTLITHQGEVVHEATRKAMNSSEVQS